MGRKLAVFVASAVCIAILLAMLSLVAQAAQDQQAPAIVNPDPVKAVEGAPRSRLWYDVADIGLRIATVVVLGAGLLGTFAVLTSLRANAYSQIYTRFQSLLLKLSEHPELFDQLKADVYTDDENNPASLTPAKPHRFIANVMVNLYEEAFLLYESRVLSIIDPLPADYWESILGSMRAAFQLKYIRTHWEKRSAVFSPKFNAFVREKILAYTGENPAPDVV
jgi:hypothetical protein